MKRHWHHHLEHLPCQSKEGTATDTQNRLFGVLPQPTCGGNISAPAKQKCVCWGQLWVQPLVCHCRMAKPMQGTSQNPLVFQGDKGLSLALPHCHQRALGSQQADVPFYFGPLSCSTQLQKSLERQLRLGWLGAIYWQRSGIIHQC